MIFRNIIFQHIVKIEKFLMNIFFLVVVADEKPNKKKCLYLGQIIHSRQL